ncbi:hypothetical protein KVR01_010742 [Diaporthe batatas]|uniref:uncharacterized protein n=1 Tax=Diaporthe batatas TaxID=748121 RepID=UPI001D045831|nr:uncharacterized protein KVR01_010742 [Diaporthe batatas]KAG8159081.1 hypothetical protein KVR01_010742 [Diaporthe batatas]
MSAHLEELAVRFVERDGLSLEDQQKIAADAADYVLDPAKHGFPQEQTVLALVKSIHRWIASGDGEQPSDFAERNREKHARGLRYLAMTLTALPKDFLQSTHIKMLSNFFSSIFQQQDPAGLSAAADALLVLITRSNFPPSSADDILTSLGDMEPENYTKQLAKTRLQILRIVQTLLLNDKSARVLQKRYEGATFLLRILPLAQKERDPVNLLEWFQTLETVLKNNEISSEVSLAAFESFSPFFPISIRKSTAGGPETTEDELKEALRTCFASNGRLAQHTFSFLLEKLDDGGSLTASAKLDILRTIRACVSSYEPVDTTLVPYVTKLWSSLKYEVRNGEVPEAIQETLSIFECLTGRLSELDDSDAALAEFLSLAWRDTADDLENPTYTEQAGSILVSVAGGSVLAFCRTNPRLLEVVRRNIGQPKSSTHTKTLLGLLNNLVRTHRRLTAKADTWSEHDMRAFDADGFEIPVAVVDDIYFKVFRENVTENPSKEQVEIAKEIVSGLSLLVEVQRLRSDFTTTAAYKEDTLREICTALSYRAINSFNVSSVASADLYTVDISAVVALKTIVKVFPEGYAKILSGLVGEVQKRTWKGTGSDRTFNDLHSMCQRIAYIGCADLPTSGNPIANFALFAGTLLKILSVLFNAEASIRFSSVVADALATGMVYFIKVIEEKGLKQKETVLDTRKIGDLESLLHAEIPDFPKLRYKQVNPYDPIPSAKAIKTAKHSVFASFQVVGVYVVSELYQHATSLSLPADSRIPLLHLSDALRSAQNIDENSPRASGNLAAYLSELGRAACLVLRELSATAQISLDLDNRVFGCFNHVRWRSYEMPLVRLHDMELYTLSRGIAEAMHFSTVMTLADINFLNLLTGNLDDPVETSPRVEAIQDYVAFLLANKFNDRAGGGLRETSVPNQAVWTTVLERIEQGLKQPESLELKEVCRFAAILAGAYARRDLPAAALASTVSHAAAKSGTGMGPYVARILSQLFSSPKKGLLDPANHTIQKPLYLQWAFQQLVQPVLRLSYPLSRDDTSVVYSIYVLHAVKSLRLSHYADDAPVVVRIVLAAMQKATNSYDVEAACGISLHILAGDPALFRPHVASLVKAAKSVYDRSFPVPAVHNRTLTVQDDKDWLVDKDQDTQGGRFRYAGDREKIRRMALRTLEVLPAQLDENDLRAYADEVRAQLCVALGDRVRDVRRAAEAAQSAWSRIST